MNERKSRPVAAISETETETLLDVNSPNIAGERKPVSKHQKVPFDAACREKCPKTWEFVYFSNRCIVFVFIFLLILFHYLTRYYVPANYGIWRGWNGSGNFIRFLALGRDANNDGWDFMEYEEKKKGLMDLAKVFMAICKKAGVTPVLHSGTLLGAWRNSKLIVWDNDLDFIVTFEEKEKLIRSYGNWSNLLPKGYGIRLQGWSREFCIQWSEEENRCLRPYNYAAGGTIGKQTEEYQRNQVRGSLGSWVPIRIWNKNHKLDMFYHHIVEEGGTKRLVPPEAQRKSDSLMSCFGCKRIEQTFVPYTKVFPLLPCKLEDMHAYCPRDMEYYLQFLYGNAYLNFPYVQAGWYYVKYWPYYCEYFLFFSMTFMYGFYHLCLKAYNFYQQYKYRDVFKSRDGYLSFTAMETLISILAVAVFLIVLYIDQFTIFSVLSSYF